MAKKFLGLIKFIYDFCYKMADDRVGIYTAQAAFFIILSFFPFFMLVLSIIGNVGISQDFFISIINSYVPETVKPLLLQIVKELFTHATGTTISITAIIAIWTASKGVLSIMFGLYNIYKVHLTRNYFISRFISMIYTVFFVFSIIVAMVFLVFGNRIINLGVSLIPALKNISLVTLLLRYLMAFLILTAFFFIIFRITNIKSTKMSKIAPGALFASLGWMVFSFVFSIYIDNFNNMSYMYGSLTAVIILMLWIYFCIYILFIGCEINKWRHPEISKDDDMINKKKESLVVIIDDLDVPNEHDKNSKSNQINHTSN